MQLKRALPIVLTHRELPADRRNIQFCSVEARFTKDELLTHVTLYWVTGTIRSAVQLYYDATNAGALTWVVEMFRKWLGSTSVPTGFAGFPRDICPPPREWADRFFNIERWTEMPRGGHFPAMEEPKLLAEDIRTFFRRPRSSGHS